MKKAAALLLAAILLFPDSLRAEVDFEQEFFLDLNAVLMANPNKRVSVLDPSVSPFVFKKNLYAKLTRQNAETTLRWSASAQTAFGLGLDFHTQVFARRSSSPEEEINLFSSASSQRSSAFNWENSGEAKLRLKAEIDRLALRFDNERLSLRAGRQALNLASNFYFTPNDFFSPFTAWDFFRLYKIGADAFRGTYHLSNFTQVDFIYVGNQNLFKVSPLNSWLSRFLFNFKGAEITLMGGRVFGSGLVGANLQWEWGGKGSLSAEWNSALSNDEDLSAGVDLAVGYSYQLSANASLRLEHFFNGRLQKSLIQAPQLPGWPDPSLKRQISALGGSVQLSALFLGGALIQWDWSSGDALTGINLIYSLSDNRDFSFTLDLPVQTNFKKTFNSSVISFLPTRLSLEIRQFF